MCSTVLQPNNMYKKNHIWGKYAYNVYIGGEKYIVKGWGKLFAKMCVLDKAAYKKNVFVRRNSH